MTTAVTQALFTATYTTATIDHPATKDSASHHRIISLHDSDNEFLVSCIQSGVSGLESGKSIMQCDSSTPKRTTRRCLFRETLGGWSSTDDDSSSGGDSPRDNTPISRGPSTSIIRVNGFLEGLKLLQEQKIDMVPPKIRHDSPFRNPFTVVNMLFNEVFNLSSTSSKKILGLLISHFPFVELHRHASAAISSDIWCNLAAKHGMFYNKETHRISKVDKDQKEKCSSQMMSRFLIPVSEMDRKDRENWARRVRLREGIDQESLSRHFFHIIFPSLDEIARHISLAELTASAVEQALKEKISHLELMVEWKKIDRSLKDLPKAFLDGFKINDLPASLKLFQDIASEWMNTCVEAQLKDLKEASEAAAKQCNISSVTDPDSAITTAFQCEITRTQEEFVKSHAYFFAYIFTAAEICTRDWTDGGNLTAGLNFCGPEHDPVFRKIRDAQIRMIEFMRSETKRKVRVSLHNGEVTPLVFNGKEEEAAPEAIHAAMEIAKKGRRIADRFSHMTAFQYIDKKQQNEVQAVLVRERIPVEVSAFSNANLIGGGQTSSSLFRNNSVIVTDDPQIFGTNIQMEVVEALPNQRPRSITQIIRRQIFHAFIDGKRSLYKLNRETSQLKVNLKYLREQKTDNMTLHRRLRTDRKLRIQLRIEKGIRKAMETLRNITYIGTYPEEYKKQTSPARRQS